MRTIFEIGQNEHIVMTISNYKSHYLSFSPANVPIYSISCCSLIIEIGYVLYVNNVRIKMNGNWFFSFILHNWMYFIWKLIHLNEKNKGKQARKIFITTRKQKKKYTWTWHYVISCYNACQLSIHKNELKAI